MPFAQNKGERSLSAPLSLSDAVAYAFTRMCDTFSVRARVVCTRRTKGQPYNVHAAANYCCIKSKQKRNWIVNPKNSEHKFWELDIFVSCTIAINVRCSHSQSGANGWAARVDKNCSFGVHARSDAITWNHFILSTWIQPMFNDNRYGHIYPKTANARVQASSSHKRAKVYRPTYLMNSIFASLVRAHALINFRLRLIVNPSFWLMWGARAIAHIPNGFGDCFIIIIIIGLFGQQHWQSIKINKPIRKWAAFRLNAVRCIRFVNMWLRVQELDWRELRHE